MRNRVRFFLNGKPHSVRGEDSFASLTNYLRGENRLVGTKVVCAEGDCGACTVLIGRPGPDGIRYDPVDSCIQFLYQIDGTHIITVEGLSNGELHPVQQAMVEHHGSQCGYCTPGFVMALAGWAEGGCTTDHRIALTGNLCRCTGYMPILEAAAAVKATPTRPSKRYRSKQFKSRLTKLAAEPIRVATRNRIFFSPATLEEAVAFKAEHPDAVIVAGGTETGVWRNKKGFDPPKLLSLARIAELNGVERRDVCLVFGANATWSEVENAIRESLPAFLPIVERFGSPQIRNVATLVGNVANGSPIADSLGLLSVMDAELEIVGPRGSRRRSINGFYTGYKQKDLAADELIARVELPLPRVNDRLRLYKVSRRFDLDIATFGAAIRIFETDGIIREAAIAYTGVAPIVVRLPKTEEGLRGQPFYEATFRRAGKIARSEIEPISDVRGSRDFRWQLAENILIKFFLEESAYPVVNSAMLS